MKVIMCVGGRKEILFHHYLKYPFHIVIEIELKPFKGKFSNSVEKCKYETLYGKVSFKD